MREYSQNRNVAKKIPSLTNAEILTDTAPQLYASDIDQLIFGGNKLFQEAVFFHKSSRSLIFTDLMVNLRTDGMKLLPRLFLKFEGVIYPNGGIPRLYRWLSRDKSNGREALGKIRQWKPCRILFCHGDAFSDAADEVLDREFGFLDLKKKQVPS